MFSPEKSDNFFCFSCFSFKIGSFLFEVHFLCMVAHHSIRFRLNFLANRTDSVGKRSGALPFGYSSLKMRKVGEKVQ